MKTVNLETKVKSIQKNYEAKKAEALKKQAEADEKAAIIKAEKKAKSNKPGVIQTIFNTIAECSKPISKAEILAVLTETFPDRKADSMQNTINAQLGKRVPNRMENEKMVIFDRSFNKNGDELFKLEL